MSLDSLGTNAKKVSGTRTDVTVSSDEMLSVLLRIESQLKIMNLYNALAQDEELTKEDIT